jgi:UDP-GlcNAc3NAcA epimerase
LKDQPLKILSIIGARPQFIKWGMVSKALARTNKVKETVLHTGQHYSPEMSEVFFTGLGLTPPKYHLNIHDLPHAAMTGRMMEGIEQVILSDKPDGIIVYGDTNSTLAGALAARMAQLPLFHVEAGMRTGESDLPEQLNRVVTDRIAQRLFCSTYQAVETIQAERPELNSSEIIHSGDVLLDAYLHYADQAETNHPLHRELASGPFIFVTLHRAYNTDDEKRLSKLLAALNVLHQSIPVVMALHPRTAAMMMKFGIEAKFHCIPAMGYLPLLAWLKSCTMVITDSGGLQKEAAFAGKFCITMRKETEWIELADAGVNRICGDDTELMMQSVSEFQEKKFPGCPDTYGKGNASEIIAASTLSYFNQ